MWLTVAAIAGDRLAPALVTPDKDDGRYASRDRLASMARSLSLGANHISALVRTGTLSDKSGEGYIGARISTPVTFDKG